MHEINKAVDRNKKPLPVKMLFVLLFILLAIVVIFAAVIIIPRILGYKEYVVKTHDMEPAVTKGTLIFVKEDDPLEIKTDDIITYTSNSGEIVTHRVDEIDRDKGEFYTKGDANGARDKVPVKYSQVIGKVGFSIPFIGALMFWK